ncbi:MAG: hypothetical protein WD397_16105 [Wenzhouxiangellaceae bacterium]
MLTTLSAHANCDKINRAPIEIDKPGNYCLSRNLETDLDRGPAIRITASNVTLDLAGFTLGNRTADGACLNGNEDSPTAGIVARGANNVTIRGGTVQCFGSGIEISAEDPNCLECSFGHTVRDMDLSQLFQTGVLVRAWSSTIESNHVFRIGGSSRPEPRGIIANGSGNTVRNNDVMFVFGPRGTGVVVAAGNANLVVENRVQQANTGFALFGGSAVRYRDNLTAEVAFDYFGIGDDLGNNQ